MSDKDQNTVEEKRIKPTVIRRRKVEAPVEPEVEVEAKVEVEAEAEAVQEAPGEEQKAKGEEKKVVSHPSPRPGAPEPKKAAPVVEEKRKALKIISQPEIGTSKVEFSGVEKTVVVEKDSDKFVKKAPKKRKSRAELDLEDIQKHGGLKQYALGVEVDPEAPVVVTEPSRVFRPSTPLHRKKKAPKGSFKKTVLTEKKASKKVIKIAEGMSVSDLSQNMGVKAQEIIKKLIGLGIMATINQMIDVDTATLIATEYGYEIENSAFKEADALSGKIIKTGSKEKTPAPEGAESRSPIVTVMGHVDHGKTSVLDVIRSAKVADGEAGGITQHIGAYSVMHNGKRITFIDTPGHAAFTHMRARGAQVTDIVILVVAADDGVMPQTKEAIDHARAAGVPIIVAINKIDKPNANIEKVKRELSEAELQPEDWGGSTICVQTSAKTKVGIDQLLEMVLLQAEIMEIKALRNCKASGIVIESKMDKHRGPVVTAIVKEGTLKVGDPIVSGLACGKVRALINFRGEPIEEAFPADAVEILGLADVPEAGEKFAVVEDDKIAKQVADNRTQKIRQEQMSRQSRVTLEDLKSRMDGGEVKELNVIVKTDVKGVADAIKDSMPGLSTKDVRIRVLHTAVGGINESDIILATASNAVVLGFNVVADLKARELAERDKVEIKTYSIIYEMLDDIKKAIAGMLKPKEVEKVLGRAEVRETFKVPKAGTIAGCYVTNGKIIRSARVRLLRDNVIIHDGTISSLRRFKDDAREVASGLECGIGIDNYQDIKNGDEIEAYIIEKIETTWEESKDGGVSKG